MSIQLDHTLVPSRNQVAAAERLAGLLDVAWAEAVVGPFAAVYVNDGLTLDFQTTDEPFPIHHFCFRVSQDVFDAILGRLAAAGIGYRSTVHGPVDNRVGAPFGNVYWNEPDGHCWEMLTVSYARPAHRA